MERMGLELERHSFQLGIKRRVSKESPPKLQEEVAFGEQRADHFLPGI